MSRPAKVMARLPGAFEAEEPGSCVLSTLHRKDGPVAINDADAVLRRDRELEWLVKDIAASPSVWAHLVQYTEPRLRMTLVGVPGIATWLMTWAPGQGSGLHDHGGSAGAFVVVRGSIRQDVVDDQGQVHTGSYQVGQVSSFKRDVVHELRNEGSEGAVTIHAFRPELIGLTSYVLEHGRLRRGASG